MNVSTITALLQLVASILTGAQHNAQLSRMATQQTIAVASQAIQLSAQAEAMQHISFAIPPNDSNAPTIKDLGQTVYFDTDGNYVPPGGSVAVVEEDTSFGDINGDGLDDAAVVLQRNDSNGNVTFALAAMLNQGGILFNITDFSLGLGNLQVLSHNIVQGGDIVLNMKVNGGSAATTTYYLLGDELMKL